jgi:CTP synthase (UTP-ammonia lyase)
MQRAEEEERVIFISRSMLPYHETMGEMLTSTVSHSSKEIDTMLIWLISTPFKDEAGTSLAFICISLILNN